MVNKCIAFQSRDKLRNVSYPTTHQIHSFLLSFHLLFSMLCLLSHLPFNVLSLPGFISSLTSIITNTHFSHCNNTLCFCYPELFFIPLLLLQVHFLLSLAVHTLSFPLLSEVFIPLSTSAATLFLLFSLHH